MDLEMYQHSINIAGTAAWIITDFLICSDAGNGFQIDGNKNFMVLKTFVHDKVHENAGIDRDKANDQHSQHFDCAIFHYFKCLKESASNNVVANCTKFSI
jgi:hypothetical protein